jgi:hypothetical protein
MSPGSRGSANSTPKQVASGVANAPLAGVRNLNLKSGYFESVRT